MKQILESILSGDFAGAAREPLPESMRAAYILKQEQEMFEDMDADEQDPRKSLHVSDVPVPACGPADALVAVLATAINYNTVWSSLFAPVSTFKFLEKLGKESSAGAVHDIDHHILGSDGAGVVLRVGEAVTRFKPGDLVTIHCNSVDMQSPEGHDDSMMDPFQKIWGYETNFGGLAEISLVKANQLMPKPAHLSWEEAACNGLVNSTAYRMLVGVNGARMKQGDIVLVWGATGGLGGYALQYCLNGGALPIAVVSSDKKAEMVRSLGVEWVIDRKAEGYKFMPDGQPDPKEWSRFGKRIRELTGGSDPDIVFEHPGRETFGASVYVARRGGKIVTCASTSGFIHEYDNRYLWMHLKSIIGSHFANYAEAWEANRLISLGKIHPILSEVFPLSEAGEAAYRVHSNAHVGKLGVLCLSPEEGLGVTDPELRDRFSGKALSWRSFL